MTTKHTTHLLASMVLLAVQLGCQEPPVDKLFAYGSVPVPTGVITGTVIYVGPRPVCSTDDAGASTRPVGQVILTLFHHDNPPPPSGSATSAQSLLIVPSTELFGTAQDCMPPEPSLEDKVALITRSASFTWPGIELGPDAETGVAYQIRGFYDADGDFLPFYGVRNLATRGDVIGGAFEDLAAATATMRRIELGPSQLAASKPRGETVAGVTVSLKAPVNTERPLFELGESTRPLSSSAMMSTHPDPLAREAELWSLAQMRLDLVAAEDPAYGAAFEKAGIDFRFDPLGYAWFVRDVDVDADGAADPHPVLGSAGVTWQTPIVVLERARTVAERRAMLPSVRLIGATLSSQTAQKRVFWPRIDIIVPPVAVVDLDPSNPVCKVPYIPPGNPAQTYEAAPTECQELPTGRYSISVLHGLAGAMPANDGVTEDSSDIMADLVGGAFSGQAWTIPNELGPADTRYNPTAVHQLDEALLLEAQGPAARFIVHDPNTAGDVREGCDMAPDPALGLARRAVQYLPVAPACCAAVEHLCHLPACRYEPVAGGRLIAAAPTGAPAAEPGGPPRLTCTPFAMPASCCGARPEPRAAQQAR